MSPSIFEMFGDDAIAEADASGTFDPSNLDAAIDKAIAGGPVAGRPPGCDPSATPAPAVDGETPGIGGGDQGDPASTSSPTPVPAPPAAQAPPPPPGPAATPHYFPE